MNIDSIEKLVIKACKELYKNDYHLIEYNLCERTLVFRFGLYFHYYMIKDSELKGYDLDVEYNKNIDEIKATRNYPNGRYVDLVVHKRGHNNSVNNILAIEFKKNRVYKDDKIKIDDLMSPTDVYRYRYGMTLTFKKNKIVYSMRSQMEDWVDKEMIFYGNNYESK